MGACLKNRCKRRVLATITACVMTGSVLLSGCKETKRTYSSKAHESQYSSETESNTKNGTYHDYTRTNVSEAHLNEYTVTPVQCHFSEPVLSTTAEDAEIAKSETADHVAASEKYLYLYSDVKERLYVYLINGEEMTLVTTVSFRTDTWKPFRTEDDITVDLLDGDFLTVYTGYPLLVENAGGKETILSCDPDIVVSPDGQTIVCQPSGKLHYDPQKKEVTYEPFELYALNQVYSYQLFVMNTNIYARGGRMLTNQNNTNYPMEYRVFEYDLDGKLIGEFNNTQRNLDMESVYDLGDELLIVNGETDAIELWDKEGNYLAGASLYSLIGNYGYGGNCIFPSYSLVRCGKSSDFILVSAYGSNPHLVEDLVYRIHIE